MRYSKEYMNDIEYTLRANAVDGLKNSSILITGATGLIGSALIDILIWLNEKEDYDMRILAASRDMNAIQKRFSPFSEKEYIKAVQYDALKPFALQESVDFVICAASNAHPESIVKEPVETMFANIIGVKNLLDYVRKHGGRLLYLSSSEVYGKKKDNGFYCEDDYGYIDILNLRSCYPSSKRAAETLCVSYFAEYNVDFVTVRPGHIYGPTQTETDSRAAAQFLRAALNGEDIVMKSSGLQLRSYCHCLDCATAILTVLLRGKKGEAYNISNSSSIITIRKYAELCAQTAGRQVIFEKPSEREQKSYNLMDCAALDSEKLKRLGWQGLWKPKEGIEETIRILKNSWETD